MYIYIAQYNTVVLEMADMTGKIYSNWLWLMNILQ